MGNKINVIKWVVRIRREWNWLCIISHPVMGFNIGVAETQGPITRVCWLLRKDGEAGSYSLFQNNNIMMMKHPNRLIYIHIFNKDVTNVETRLFSEYTFIHKIKSIMQDKNLNERAKSCNINNILLKQALQTGKIQVLRQTCLPTVLFYLP